MINKTLNVLTFNTRVENVNFKDINNPWDVRKQGIAKIINKYDVDILGTQELEKWQHDELMILLNNKYESTGKPRDKAEDERCSIIYKKEKYKLIDSNTIWLSKTPSVVGSKDYGSAFPRILTYAKFLDIKTNKTFYFFNTHLDHESSKARGEGLKIIIEEINKYKNRPLILTGDFNMNFSDENFNVIKESSKLINTYNTKDENNLTFHNYTGDKKGSAIDFIFYTQRNIKLIQSEIIYDKYKNIYPSDHYPVYAKLQF